MAVKWPASPESLPAVCRWRVALLVLGKMQKKKKKEGKKYIHIMMLLKITEAAHSIPKEQSANTENMTSFWILRLEKNITKKDIRQWQDKIRCATSSQAICQMWQRISDMISCWRGFQRCLQTVDLSHVFRGSDKGWQGWFSGRSVFLIVHVNLFWYAGDRSAQLETVSNELR